MNQNAVEIRLVVTDLDGTLLNNKQGISIANLEEMWRLKRLGVKLAAATGRSLFKVKNVVPDTIPFDFIIFSSGAGIYDWKKKKLLTFEEFDRGISPIICDHLNLHSLNYLVFKPIPNNNKFWYHQGAGKCKEFESYVERHQEDCTILKNCDIPEHAGQFLCIIENNVHIFQAIKAELYQLSKKVKVIRTTSPVDDQYIWLEIFPESVSKGHGIGWLCDYLSISSMQTIGVGNDYNDLDMLDFVGVPYVVSNAPAELKNNYISINYSNEEDGFAKIIQEFFVD